MINHNLPSHPTPFIGRVDELAEITRQLTDPACRLLTLAGPGGSGKTRLAIEVASGKLDDFPDGVYYVGLAPINSAEHLISKVASVVDARFYEGDAPKQQLLGYLHEKQMLLVIDNFEHLLDGVSLVAEILESAPAVTILATSREALKLRAEWVYHVEGMRFPENGYVEEIKGYCAVQLFAMHARRMRQDFSSEEDWASIARVCQLVEGMPLGIELAASWVKTLSCAVIAREIERNVDFLATTLRDVPERHRSMRAVFDHSWKLLSDQEQNAFCKLAVFRGRFGRESAEQVAGASLLILSALVDKSLVRVTPSGYYEMHELLRQYAGEQLEASGQANTVRDAHRDYYTGFMSQRTANLKGQGMVEAGDEIEVEFANVRLAWYRAVKQRDYAAIERAIESMYMFCEMRSRHDDAVKLFQKAKERFAPRLGEEPSPLWCRILLSWYDMYLYVGVPEPIEEIRAQAEQCLATAQKQGDNEAIAYAFLLLGVITESPHENLPEAIEFYKQSLDYCREVDDSYWVTVRIGLSHKWLGLHAEAKRLFRQALEHGREIGHQARIAWGLSNIGVIACWEGDYTEGENYLRESNQIFREIGTIYGVIWTNADLSRLAFYRGDFEQADILIAEALELGRRINYAGVGKKNAQLTQGYISLVEETYPSAVQLFGKGLIKKYDNPETNLGMTFAACGQGDYQEAKKHIQVALQSSRPPMSPSMKLLALSAAALILAHEREQEWAVELLALAFHYLSNLLGKWPQIMRLRTELETELPPEVFSAAWERGAALNLDTVIAALMNRFQAAPSPQSAQPMVDPLTERELEVLRLVAAGMSNREIARELVIALGTVKTHVHNISGKLGVTNRTQAAAQAKKFNLL